MNGKRTVWTAVFVGICAELGCQTTQPQQGRSPARTPVAKTAARPDSKSVRVWVDDAHTRQITVPKLNADDIAHRSKRKLSLSLGFAHVGLSVKWEKQKGLNYSEKSKELIAQLKQLCLEFNSGSLSLETYRRRLRSIYRAEEKARKFRDAVFMLSRQKADAAMAEMDKILGVPPAEMSKHKGVVETVLLALHKQVGAVPFRGPLPRRAAVADTGEQDVKAAWERVLREQGKAVASSFEDFSRTVAALPTESRRSMPKMQIYRDRRRTQMITVPKIDASILVRDVEESLNFRPSFFGFGLGKGLTFNLKGLGNYDRATQALLVKCRQLIMEYNSGHLSQEEYVDRLAEIYAAEDKARQARQQMFLLMCQQSDEATRDLDKQLAKRSMVSKEDAALAGDMERMALKMRTHAAETTPKDRITGTARDILTEMTLAARQSLAARHVAELGKCVDQVKVAPPGEMVEIWVDDARTRKVSKGKLDPETIASLTKRTLTLGLSYYGFGPQMNWAKRSGLQYDQAVQELIVKYKQLCVDFNAGLLTQESFDRRRRQIDQAIEKAEQVREEMFQFQRRLARAAFDQLDHYTDVLEGRTP